MRPQVEANVTIQHATAQTTFDSDVKMVNQLHSVCWPMQVARLKAAKACT